MKRKYLLAVGLLFLTYAACKKENNVQPLPGTNVTPIVPVDHEMIRITRSEWLIYKVDANGTDVWQIPGIIETCTKDDTYRFYKDSILTSYENSNICSGRADSTRSNWQFIDGRKKLSATLLGGNDTADIVLLTDTTMNLLLNYNGTDATIFFKKK